MTRVQEVVVCPGFSDLKWQLPVDVPPGWRRGLIGWRLAPSPVDGGVPEPVARILASSLVSHARVTFAEGVARRSGGFDLSFVHTIDAREAERLFDAAYVSWTMGGQLAFLSSPSAPQPGISKSDYETRLDETQFLHLAQTGVTGLLAPGVDGDVAGLYSFDDTLWTAILGSLKTATEAVGAVWREVDERELADLLVY